MKCIANTVKEGETKSKETIIQQTVFMNSCIFRSLVKWKVEYVLEVVVKMRGQLINSLTNHRPKNKQRTDK